MKIFDSFVLALSGSLIATSIILAKVGLNRSALSRRSASLLAGLGAGMGNCVFIYYGVSSHDFVGSLITGIITAMVVGFAILFPTKWWK